MNNPKYLIFDLCGVIFDYNPTLAAQLVYTNPAQAFIPLEDGVRILEQCYAAKNNPANPLKKIYAFSNASEIAYKTMTTYYPQIFECFDEVMASFQTGYKKPDIQAFHYFLSTHNLKAEDCIFIDDKEHNVLAAQSIGIHGIVCHDFVYVEEQLKKFGILD